MMKMNYLHYSNATTDIEYKFPFGSVQLSGIASRTDFDLRKHAEHSEKISDTMIQKQTKNIFHIVSSHHLVQIV